MPMLPRHDEPIAAIATAPGRAGIGIVRASGRDLSSVLLAVCGRPLAPRLATYLPFRAADGTALDHGIALHFPGPQSATGEDVLELHAHGGPVVLQLLLKRLLEAGTSIGLRLARAGEFSERAYVNGKLDLAQAEAVADLIDASTDAAARSAVRSLSGAFSRDVHAVRDAVVALRLLIEATLDFPDEEIDILHTSDVRGRLASLAVQIDTVLARTRQGALLQRGLTVVIAGQPNVGKSSLLNALAGQELAIVSPIAGTTRDKIGAAIEVGGLPVQIVDTAGLRTAADDQVERIGIDRAWDAVDRADAVLWLRDATRRGDADDAAADAGIAARLPPALRAAGRLIEVHTKVDLMAPTGGAVDAVPAELPASPSTGRPGSPPPAPAAPGSFPILPPLRVSSLTGAGLPALRRRLLEVAGAEPASEDSYTARARHVAALQACHAHAATAAQQVASATAPALELCAEELRLAQTALDSITGEFTADDLLGEIFGRFCIGK